LREIILHSGWEKTLVAVPLLGLLFAAYFRLDEIVTKRKKGRKLTRHGSGLGPDGEPQVFDPDGKVWTGEDGRK